MDAFETDKMCLLKFDSLPGTDVVSYLAEKPMYTEQMVADITGQILGMFSYKISIVTIFGHKNIELKIS